MLTNHQADAEELGRITALMANIPFRQDAELNQQLVLEESPSGLRRSDGSSVSLPGQARILLTDSAKLKQYLMDEHLTTDLDILAPKLWLVSTPRYWHISSLHHQKVRGRNIIVTENPHLHLVWYYDRIFIKPLPRYMLSHAFWEYLETRPLELRKAITGFVRTYSYLVRYERDFTLATSEADHLCLIPRDDGASNGDDSSRITFERFAKFISNFDEISDKSVSPRYRHGELRLSRLNTCARLFLGKATFHHIDAQWGAYLGRFLAPLLSIFAILSVALSAMQVELGAQVYLNDLLPSWMSFALVSRGFSCLVLVTVAIVIIFFGLLLAFMFFHDLWFARSVLRQRCQAPVEISTKFRSGVV